MKKNPIYVKYEEISSHAIYKKDKCIFLRKKKWIFKCDECNLKIFVGASTFDTRKQAKDAYYMHLDRYH